LFIKIVLESIMSEHKHHHHTSEHSSHGNHGKRLLLASVLNALITIAEITGGILSNSLALLSDALHNLSDTIAILIAYVANLAARGKANEKRTFGYKRVEILAALFNSVVLIAICLFLFVEAIKRLKNPEEIKGLVMLIIATIGLFANLAAVLLLHRDSSHNLNTRAAYLHLLGDTLSSIAVIIGGVLIYFFHIYWLDPALTIFIGLYIIYETFKILKETVVILMQGTPEHINIEEIKQTLESIPGIMNIHHIHVWTLSDSDIHFECHIDLKDDIKVSETHVIQNQVSKLLFTDFNINHLTLQFEAGCCDDKGVINLHR
jgi:cobalt-zinc-cadmium efflux system protein